MCMLSVSQPENFLISIMLFLGIVLYELLAGTLPYNDVTNKDQVGRAKNNSSIIIENI